MLSIVGSTLVLENALAHSLTCAHAKPDRHLEIAADDEQIDLGLPLGVQLPDGGVDVVQLPMTAALHSYLREELVSSCAVMSPTAVAASLGSQKHQQIP